MGINKAAIYSSAVVLALVMGGPAQAQNKGASAAAPGQTLRSAGPSATGTGHGASDYAPGYQFQKSFKTIEGAHGASGLGGVGAVSGPGAAPGHTIAPGFQKKPQ